MAKQKILLIEDSHFQANQVKQFLEASGYEVIWAESGLTGFKMVKTESPDAVILDLVLPDAEGTEICRWIKMNDQTKGIPVIILTQKGSIEDKVTGFHIGANDYLTKPFSEVELHARVYASLRTKQLQDELRQKNQQLEELLVKVERMAATDPTTGIYNRRRFFEVLEGEFARAKRFHTPLSCLMLDIDFFKRVNDTWGHQAGDSVLQEVAQIMMWHIREVDTLARYGGEEFIILLPHTETASALLPADRILQEVASHQFHAIPVGERVTASVGIAGVPHLEIDTSEKLIRCADMALYKAKQNGRNRIEVFEGMEESV